MYEYILDIGVYIYMPQACGSSSHMMHGTLFPQYASSQCLHHCMRADVLRIIFSMHIYMTMLYDNAEASQCAPKTSL